MPDIFTQTSDEKVSQLALIESIRSLSDSMTALRGDMRDDKKILQEVRESLIRIEGADHPSKIRENKLAINSLAVRVAALEAHQNKREGVTGFVNAIMKSPALGWFVGAATAVWAVLSGKVNL